MHSIKKLVRKMKMFLNPETLKTGRGNGGSFSDTENPHDERKDPGQSADRQRSRAFGSYLFTVLACTLLLGISIAGIFEYNRKKTQEVFTAMTTENLNSYIAGQKTDTLAKIDKVIGKLEAMAVFIEQRNEEELIDTYLLALNENSYDTQYIYTSAQQLRQRKQEGSSGKLDEEYIERLENGETVVSDVIFSKRRGNIYCIAIGVPVMKDGRFFGVIRAVVNARGLVSTNFYPPAQGRIAACFLTYGDGTVVRAESGNGTGVINLLDQLKSDQVDETVLEELKAAYGRENVVESIQVGTYSQTPVYLSMADLGYNDWHLLVCMEADMAAAHSGYLVRSTVVGTAVCMILLLSVFLVLLLFLWRLQRKMTLEEKRYLLLEQFSDTVLFDYDCRSDTMRFTDNAAKLMKYHEMVMHPFLKSTETFYVHNDDLNVMNRVLGGHSEKDTGEEHIRLARPSDGQFFWCQVRYRYLYAKGEVVSVIGRISDADEQKQREEYLQIKSETDGLTGFLNRQAVELRVNDCLGRNPHGTLFMMDMDRFKEINDTYGHTVGDQALKFLASCIRKTFRSEDLFGRTGGDEVVVYMEGYFDSRVAEKKIRSLQMHLAEGENEGLPMMSASVGTAAAPEDGADFKKLFEEADGMMYRIKQEKKNAGR